MDDMYIHTTEIHPMVYTSQTVTFILITVHMHMSLYNGAVKHHGTTYSVPRAIVVSANTVKPAPHKHSENCAATCGIVHVYSLLVISHV